MQSTFVALLVTNQAINFFSYPQSSDFYQNYPTSYCGGTKLIGGFNIFGLGFRIDHTFDLPRHTRLKIIAKFMLIDSWDSEILTIQIDGKTVKQFIKGPYDGPQICGDGRYGEVEDDFYWEDDHIADTIRITVYDNLNDPLDNESWGIIDFQILYEDECIKLYSECEFLGSIYYFCQDSPNQLQKDFPIQIKSIKIPIGKTLELQNNNNNGNVETFTSDNNCMEPFNFPVEEYNP